MYIQCGGGNSVDDFEDSGVSDELGGGGEELGVEGIELVWIRVCPEGQTVNAPDNLEGCGEGVDDITAGEAGGSSWDLRGSLI